ncbi:MAG: WXG100 family type VII secretion target [Lachnospiraceae bacterium]|nr:WXG100 family type VII secretion target [Lachnospiraceae bacterium]
MAGRASIEFNFRKAMEQAEQLEGTAERLSRLSNYQFENTMQQLAANWKGENASEYMNKGDRLQQQMNGTAKELYNIAADIRRVAKRLYQAEMEALRIAQKRDY